MASITLDIKSELPAALLWSTTLAKQLPFATSVALNQTAFDVRQTLNTGTTRFFDRPNRFTQTAFLVNKSTKQDLQVTIYANADKGYDRARYLQYGIEGGIRRQKGFERKFLAQVAATARIPSGAELIPTRLVKLDASGNVSLATIKRIQAGLQGNARGGFFIGQPRNNPNLPPGIYRRSRSQLFPYFFATDKRSAYRPRFPIAQLGTDKAQAVFAGYLRSSLEKALATAR
jgi:hypothetical protein